MVRVQSLSLCIQIWWGFNLDIYYIFVAALALLFPGHFVTETATTTTTGYSSIPFTYTRHVSSLALHSYISSSSNQPTGLMSSYQGYYTSNSGTILLTVAASSTTVMSSSMPASSSSKESTVLDKLVSTYVLSNKVTFINQSWFKFIFNGI